MAIGADERIAGSCTRSATVVLSPTPIHRDQGSWTLPASICRVLRIPVIKRESTRIPERHPVTLSRAGAPPEWPSGLDRRQPHVEVAGSKPGRPTVHTLLSLLNAAFDRRRAPTPQATKDARVWRVWWRADRALRRLDVSNERRAACCFPAKKRAPSPTLPTLRRRRSATERDRRARSIVPCWERRPLPFRAYDCPDVRDGHLPWGFFQLRPVFKVFAGSTVPARIRRLTCACVGRGVDGPTRLASLVAIRPRVATPWPFERAAGRVLLSTPGGARGGLPCRL